MANLEIPEAGNTIFDYPAKLQRFAPKSCMAVYFGQPIAYGAYNQVERYIPILNDPILPDGLGVNNVCLKITATEKVGWFQVGSYVDASWFAGKILAVDGNDFYLELHKEAFVTLEGLTAALNKHNGIQYRMEVKRFWNDTGVTNASITDVKIQSKTRINNYQRYSVFDFDYTRDYKYKIKTNRIKFANMQALDDVLRAGKVILRSLDDSAVYDGALDDQPKIIGVSGETSGILNQPYFGGTQNNTYYPAVITNTEYTWSYGAMRVQFEFEIKV